MTTSGDPDAVVIGAGPNGLVAANVLADAGWSVVVLEAQPEPGGAVKSGEVTAPGFTSDLFSAFYPLAAASGPIRALELERHGLRWLRAPVAVAHPLADGRCAALATADPEATAASVERFAAGDGAAWLGLYAEWRRIGEHLIDGLVTPFPPLRAGARLVAALGPRELPAFLRFALLPVRRLGEERFAGEGAPLLLAGNALHADLTPEAHGSGLFGLVLCGLAQRVGFPCVEGGAGNLTAAMVRRLESLGGRVECSSRVSEVVVRRRRAVGVRTEDGRSLGARRAVLADTGAPALYLRLLPPDAVPDRLRGDMRRRFQYDSATIKVDWALDGPIPWAAEDARRAGTVHVAEGLDGLSDASEQLARHSIPSDPFLLLGQYSMADPSRAPAGKEAAWAYTHLPHRPRRDARGELSGDWDGGDKERFADRMEDQVERLAPGFRGLVRARHVMGPPDLERANENLVGGSVNGGTAQLHQQLVFRPAPGLGRPETPVRGLYLASASAHPGGGVHGGPGSNAARAALAAARVRGVSLAPTLARLAAGGRAPAPRGGG